MAKVHITLVGGQPAPVYKGIIDERPERVMLVCSSDSIGLADNVKKYACLKIDGLYCEKVQMSAVSIQKIKKKIKEIAASINEYDTVTVNISGGTKVWSTLFYDFFKERATCICLDQNDNKYDFRAEQSTKINARIDMAEALWLNGIMVTGMHFLSEYTDEDFKAAETVRRMRGFSIRNFNELMKCVENDPAKGYWYVGDNNYLSWSKEDNSYSLSLTSKWATKVENICSPNVKKIMLNTGWFELEVARLLGEWDMAEQVSMNCELKSSKDVDGPPLNEIDIIVNVGGKLLFVECKTQVKNATDVDKFRNAVRYYGGLSAKSIFITDAVMRGQAKAKCDSYGIPAFSMQEITKNKDGKAGLFKILRSYMGGLNIR